jgi:Na+-driven multidrug efflux pump
MSEATETVAATIDPVEPLTEQPKSRFDRSIIEGPLGPAVWKIAWPTMLTNIIAGMQGIVDHILVGNLVGYKANAAIGISFQIFLVVIVFISSLFTGMSVLVARFAGAHNEEKVNNTVYQAFLTAAFIAIGIMAPVGYFISPYLLDLVSPDAGVKAEALPFLRITFVFSFGLMIYFMTSGALRSAGDAKNTDDTRDRNDDLESGLEYCIHPRSWTDT